MTRHSRVWWVVALVFTVGNLVAAIYSAAQAEQLHTDLHIALVLVGGYFVWRLTPKRVANS
jgi:hypothetical protein